jgi:hypothetical protein
VSPRMYFELQQYPMDLRAQADRQSPRVTFNPLNIAGADVAVELQSQNLVPNMNREATDGLKEAVERRWDELFGAPLENPVFVPSQWQSKDGESSR